MQSSNPALNTNFNKNNVTLHAVPLGEAMTVEGTTNKTAILLLCVMATACWTWMKFAQGGAAAVTPWMYGGAIVGFILSLVTIFKTVWSPITAPLYSLCQGLFIGGISAMMQASFPGIAFQAAALTFGTLAAMLILFRTGMIQMTDKLRLGIFAATGAIALVYLVSFVLSFFGVHPSFIYGNGAFSIGFSLIVVAVAAFNLIVDFDFISQSAKRGLPKYMEWYGAFALMVTLVWLYIEMLRLLAKVRSRD
jgi:uncharacterized YccA/Bax inhibitor family protein